jgi:hypothetical protein
MFRAWGKGRVSWGWREGRGDLDWITYIPLSVVTIGLYV